MKSARLGDAVVDRRVKVLTKLVNSVAGRTTRFRWWAFVLWRQIGVSRSRPEWVVIQMVKAS